jgi:hypothetical protein
VKSLGLGWRIALGLAGVFGLIALNDVYEDYRRSGAVNWAHLSVAVGIPLVVVLLSMMFSPSPPSGKR